MNDKNFDTTISDKKGPIISYEANDIKENSYYNGSHCLDLTAHDAIKRIDDQDSFAEMRYKTFLKTIFSICKLSGFYIENRIEENNRKNKRRSRKLTFRNLGCCNGQTR